MQMLINIDEDYVKIINKNGASNYAEEVIKNGQPLPKDCEILTREAYEDLCLRASKASYVRKFREG